MTAKHSAKQLKIDARRRRVAELYLQGYRNQQAIADQLGNVNRRTVGLDLKAIRRWWREDAVFEFKTAVAEELARINCIEREAWATWEKSKTPLERSRSGQQRGPAGDRQIVQIEKEDRCGDPRYLDKVAWCIERRCQLLGLDAPKQVFVDSIQVDEAIERELEAMAARNLATSGAGSHDAKGVPAAPVPRLAP
jgi:hypothetical protein